MTRVSDSPAVGELFLLTSPSIELIIDDAIRRIRQAGKAPGILTSVEADARHWFELGCLFVAVGTDTGILAGESERLAGRFKTP